MFDMAGTVLINQCPVGLNYQENIPNERVDFIPLYGLSDDTLPLLLILFLRSNTSALTVYSDHTHTKQS